MPSIKEIEQEIIDEFGLFEDWMDKYQYIIDMGKALEEMDPKYQTEANIVHGCQSKVWLIVSKGENGSIIYNADSDAFITKGLIGLLVRVLSGQKPEDIAEADLDFIDTIGMRQNLSTNRSNGLSAMIGKMKDYAIAVVAGVDEKIEAKVESPVVAAVSSIASDNASAKPRKALNKVEELEIEDQKSEFEDKRTTAGKITEQQVIEVMRTIYDPEIPVNIYDLGLIYKITLLDKDGVRVMMTLTAPNCPVAGTFPATVRDRIMYDLETDEVEVNLTFDPPYTMEMMSEAAKLELGFA